MGLRPMKPGRKNDVIIFGAPRHIPEWRKVIRFIYGNRVSRALHRFQPARSVIDVQKPRPSGRDRQSGQPAGQVVGQYREFLAELGYEVPVNDVANIRRIAVLAAAVCKKNGRANRFFAGAGFHLPL